jgi:hypothetical protein
MLMLPWVSRSLYERVQWELARVLSTHTPTLAYDNVKEERDWLRTELAKLQDHTLRMERLQAGAPELPPEKRKPAPELTQRIMDAIKLWGDSSIREHLEHKALRALARGVTEEKILEMLEAEEGEE